MLVKSLTCELLPSPIAVDATQPRLGWMLVADDEERAKVQSAYQVLVASSPNLLNANEGDVWDSGKVSSAAYLQDYFRGIISIIGNILSFIEMKVQMKVSRQ